MCVCGGGGGCMRNVRAGNDACVRECVQAGKSTIIHAHSRTRNAHTRVHAHSRSSHIHHDGADNLLCVVAGAKTVLLWSPWHTAALYPCADDDDDERGDDSNNGNSSSSSSNNNNNNSSSSSSSSSSSNNNNDICSDSNSRSSNNSNNDICSDSNSRSSNNSNRSRSSSSSSSSGGLLLHNRSAVGSVRHALRRRHPRFFAPEPLAHGDADKVCAVFVCVYRVHVHVRVCSVHVSERVRVGGGGGVGGGVGGGGGGGGGAWLADSVRAVPRTHTRTQFLTPLSMLSNARGVCAGVHACEASEWRRCG